MWTYCKHSLIRLSAKLRPARQLFEYITQTSWRIKILGRSGEADLVCQRFWEINAEGEIKPSSCVWDWCQTVRKSGAFLPAHGILHQCDQCRSHSQHFPSMSLSWCSQNKMNSMCLCLLLCTIQIFFMNMSYVRIKFKWIKLSNTKNKQIYLHLQSFK